jgi:hypothetical protein
VAQQLCADPLRNQSFEASRGGWGYYPDSGVFRSASASQTGFYALRAATFDGTFYTPAFFQPFRLPDWFAQPASLQLSFYGNVRSYMSDPADQQADRFYALLATGPDPASASVVAGPVAVMDGQSSAGLGMLDPAGWRPYQVDLPLAAGLTPRHLAGQELYLLLYNRSNASPPLCAGGCKTQFYFDDVALRLCSGQAAPVVTPWSTTHLPLLLKP